MHTLSPHPSDKISSTALTSSKKKRQASGGSSSTSKNVIILLVMLAAILGIFLMIGYLSHVQLGSEFDSTKQFVFNRLHRFEDALNLTQEENQLLNDFGGGFPLKKKHTPVPALPPKKKEIISDTSISTVSKEDRVILKPSDYDIHTLKCPHSDVVTFWKRPTTPDLKYRVPYLKYGPKVKYVTFEPGSFLILSSLHFFFVFLFFFRCWRME
jgi:hypothetical protein